MTYTLIKNGNILYSINTDKKEFKCYTTKRELKRSYELLKRFILFK